MAINEIWATWWIVKSIRHYSDIIMGAMASQMTSLTTVYSSVYSGADQRKHQSSASLAFVRRIHRWPVNSPHSYAENVSVWWRLMTSSWGIQTHDSLCRVSLWFFLSVLATSFRVITLHWGNYIRLPNCRVATVKFMRKCFASLHQSWWYNCTKSIPRSCA